MTYGASYCPKMLPIPTCIHIFCLHHVFGAPGHSHSRFYNFLCFSPWLGSCFANSEWLGSLLGIFLVVFLITWLGKMFLGCTTSVRRDPQFLGVAEFVFGHVRAINDSRNRIVQAELFYSISILDFGCVHQTEEDTMISEWVLSHLHPCEAIAQWVKSILVQELFFLSWHF